jgi:hypothetical protein
MLKKAQLSEKLKKLRLEGASAEPINKSKSPPVMQQPKAEVSKTVKKKKKPRTKVKKAKKEEPILKVKKTGDISETKPEEIIEPLIEEKKEFTFISDFAIPSDKLIKLFKIETSYTEDSLTQLLTAWKDPEKIIKWTVKYDKTGSEFYSLREEGLLKMRDNPPIFGMELEEGAIISTRLGEYTFIMGCYNFDVKTLVKIFTFGVENAKRFI